MACSLCSECHFTSTPAEATPYIQPSVASAASSLASEGGDSQQVSTNRNEPMKTECGDDLTLGVSTAAGKTAAVIHRRPSSLPESEAITVSDEQESGVDQSLGHQLLCQRHKVSSQIVAAWLCTDKQMRRRPVPDIDSETGKDSEYDAEGESSDDDFAKVSKRVATAVQVLGQLRHQEWKSDGRRKSQRRRFAGGGMQTQSNSCSNASHRNVEHSIGPVAQPSFVQSGNNKRRKIH